VVVVAECSITLTSKTWKQSRRVQLKGNEIDPDQAHSDETRKHHHSSRRGEGAEAHLHKATAQNEQWKDGATRCRKAKRARQANQGCAKLIIMDETYETRMRTDVTGSG